MRSIKTVALLLSAAFFFAACCTSAPKEINNDAAAPVLLQESIEGKDFQIKDLESQMNMCQTAADCKAVFPSCCGVAYQPYFINAKHAEHFTKEYRKIFPQDCSQPARCPRSYFGGMQADCINGTCGLLEPAN